MMGAEPHKMSPQQKMLLNKHDGYMSYNFIKFVNCWDQWSNLIDLKCICGIILEITSTNHYREKHLEFGWFFICVLKPASLHKFSKRLIIKNGENKMIASFNIFCVVCRKVSFWFEKISKLAAVFPVNKIS